mgnify:CR=1 FL=1
MNENNQLVRALGLKESISMTIGTVVGVGLFTCGSAQIGSVGSWIIGFTFVALVLSMERCLQHFLVLVEHIIMPREDLTEYGLIWQDGII